MKREDPFSVTKDEKRKLNRRIKQIKLPPLVSKYVKRFEVNIGTRRRYLWKWVYYTVTSRNPGLTLSTAPGNEISKLADMKTIFTIFTTALDDLVEKQNSINELVEVFRFVCDASCIDLAREDCPSSELEFLYGTWNLLLTELSKLNNFKEFDQVFSFDTLQMLNSLYYSYLVNKVPET